MSRTLELKDLDGDPLRQFAEWFELASASGLAEPGAMTVATVGPDNKPSARMMLLKGFDEKGFSFFSNYESRKAHELEANPRAAIVFYWEPLSRQVRIEGKVSRLTRSESERYYRSRLPGSRLGFAAEPGDWLLRGAG